MDFSEIEVPAGFVFLNEIPSFLFRNASSNEDFGISKPFVASEYYSGSGKHILEAGLKVVSRNRNKADVLFGCLESAFSRGDLRSIGFIMNDADLVALSQYLWRIPQAPVAAPLDPAGLPFYRAVAGEPIKLLPMESSSPIALVMVSVFDLATYLGAQRLPAKPEADVRVWRDWLDQHRLFKSKRINTEKSVGSREAADKHNWTLMWQELLRRAMSGSIPVDITQARLAEEIQEWFAVVDHAQVPDIPLIVRRIEALFDDKWATFSSKKSR